MPARRHPLKAALKRFDFYFAALGAIALTLMGVDEILSSEGSGFWAVALFIFAGIYTGWMFEVYARARRQLSWARCSYCGEYHDNY